MTEEKFTELVNLYLDKEISESGLVHLKAELSANAPRRAEFRERCQLHQAMRLALSPKPVKRRSGSKRSRSSRSRNDCAARQGDRSGLRSAPISTRMDASADQHVGFPRWVMGAGLAACLALGCALLMPVFRDTTSVASLPALEGIDVDELVEEDPLDRIGHAELRRFASSQEQRTMNQRASIAAQLRLMGLRPELTPKEKQLRSVSLAATQPVAPVRNDAAFLQEVQKMTPMPAPQILSTGSIHEEPAVRWPGGFHSSLASFK